MAKPLAIPMFAAVMVVTPVLALAAPGGQSSGQPAATPAPTVTISREAIDGLMAPVALYPDQLLAQMLMSATTPRRVKELDTWLKTKPPFTGTALQDAARQAGYEPSLVALVLFPQVVDFMATNLDWTVEVGQAFSNSRPQVLDSVQRLRADAMKAGKLQSTPQQNVSVMTPQGGQQQQVVVIEPANEQVVHVPQYNTQTVYTQPPTSTTVVIQEDDDAAEAVAAGMIGFTAGIAMGAAFDNNYYYGPYGFHGGPYMYNDSWDDFYDDRADAREDFYENREDIREDYGENRQDLAESRSERASEAREQRGERSSTSQQQRSERAANAQAQRSAQGGQATGERAANAQAQRSSGQAATAASASSQARGQNRDRSSTSAARSGTRSDAFSNYSSGRSERAASSRGTRSSGGRSGGGRSGGRGGGGGRRR